MTVRQWLGRFRCDRVGHKWDAMHMSGGHQDLQWRRVCTRCGAMSPWEPADGRIR